MIDSLDHTNIGISKKIRIVFQTSYAVEAKLLQAKDFPPLKRSLTNFINCDSQFFGVWKFTELASVIEVKSDANTTHIQSLVVDPSYFRQGLAQQLITFVFNNFQSKLFTVETGVDNKPAIALYKKFQFIEVKQWDTDHGIRKVRFERKI